MISFGSFLKTNKLISKTSIDSLLNESLKDYTIIPLNQDLIPNACNVLQKKFNDTSYTPALLGYFLEDGNNHFCLIHNNQVKGYLTIITTEIGLYVANLVSDIPGGGTTLINYVLGFQQDVFVISIDDMTCAFYEKFGFAVLSRLKDGGVKMVRVNPNLS